MNSPPPATPAPTSVQNAAQLTLLAGKSLVLNTTERIKRISITDPEVADAEPVTPTQVLVHGKAPGEVTLLIWDEQEHPRSFDVRVEADVSDAAGEIKQLFPNEPIEVKASRSALLLSGHVSSEGVAKQAAMVAETYSKNVVNMLTFGVPAGQEVLLQVKFAEVDRSAVTQLGVNLFTPGSGNTIGTSSTGQFGGFTISQGNVTSTTASGVTSTTPTNQTNINLTNPLNLFLFRTDINAGLVIQALQQKNLLQILAEPNLIAANGKESSFVAGGEFPFPIVQPGQGFTAVTIQFKEFGVRLKFTPQILPNGNIHLRVAPEVSQLDFTNALTISGFTVPALSTRRADSEFELQDGQSFVIAGLMDNRVTNIASKVPGLGDIPILGNFFKSKNAQKSKTELMVLCTATVVSPGAIAPPLPKFPAPFLDKDKFDQGKPAVVPKPPAGGGK